MYWQLTLSRLSCSSTCEKSCRKAKRGTYLEWWRLGKLHGWQSSGQGLCDASSKGSYTWNKRDDSIGTIHYITWPGAMVYWLQGWITYTTPWSIWTHSAHETSAILTRQRCWPQETAKTGVLVFAFTSLCGKGFLYDHKSYQHYCL